ncbi:MAG TPA: tetratricopeptide repeat protein [Candidatus Polarisedimenticolaceae bacterium]|nr:tetratricopeptide repeat protein [Candidatus Polarisedimenticolaceae bacterium]
MRRTIPFALLPLLAVTCGLAGLPSGEGTGDDGSNPVALERWTDPTFQKEFLGSYGFQAELEPRVTSVEREKMEEILRLMSGGSDTDAIEELERYLAPPASNTKKKRDPDFDGTTSAIFDFTLGNLYFQREELERAAASYENAIAKFPSFRRAHKNLGLIRVRQGDFDKAVDSLSEVIELGGRDGLTFGLLGYAYSSTGQFVSAETAYRNAVLLQPETLDWKLGLTQSVFKQQKFGEAVTLCEELIETYPERADYWILQANAYIGLGRPLAAAENFEIVQRMGKATVPSLYMLGDIYVNEGLWDLALRAYGLAVAGNPQQPVTQPMQRVEVLAQRGALDQAKALLSEVKRVFGDRIEADDKKKLLKLEARVAVADGEGGASVGVLEEIVAIDPLDGDALILLGQHYAKQQEPERAIFYYERAESIEEFEAEAKVRHAQLLVELSRYEAAVPLLKRAQELEPRDDVANYLEQVERIARSRR